MSYFRRKSDKWLRLARDEKLREQGGKCIYCRSQLTTSKATLEHKKPVSRGGRDNPGNLAASCRLCNQTKGSLTDPQFRKLIKSGEGDIQLRLCFSVRKINLAAERACTRILRFVGAA